MKSAREEWSERWQLPFIAMLGATGAPMFGYASGVLVEPVTRDLGWTRAEFYSAVTIQSLLAMVLVPLVGRLIDRIGSRRMALLGSLTFAFAFSCFSLVDRPLWQWWALSALMCLGGAVVTQPVWVRPVVLHFEKSRGLATAIALSGNGLATSAWPLIAAYCIATFGWRLTFPVMAAGWLALVLPLTAIWFREGPHVRDDRADPGASPDPLPRLLPVLRSSTFLLLTAGGALFSGAAFGLTLHLVPIMRSHDIALDSAVGIASLAGICAIIGRVGTGTLLDRFSTGLIAVIVFLMPALAAAMLGLGANSVPLLIGGTIILGLAAGAEIDVVTYIAAKWFDRRIFGSVFAAIIAVFGAVGSAGPLLAGWIFDRFGGYGAFLATVAAASLVSTVLVSLAISIRATARPD